MKTSTLIDTNILIDVWGFQRPWTGWSQDALVRCREEGALLVNAIVWSEIAPSVEVERLVAYVDELDIGRENLPFAAAYQAGLAHARYRKAGGTRERTLPDFLIGAHARHGGHRLLTRDASRYRKYFPDLEIIAPDTHP
ncbi:PIN domain-containing protein [Chelativorans sp. ZYF759]|uniref:type II toxin-antitoxin system VapC family toxin n=1 Tax=Chelativorans sp. ZYF759 TaxID=2692213 RepID=UPI00145DC164|nr:type II toxin-antitoxin system VapC family toxin [Chelativorans sp. ZYF759]NMG41983.1 PIN domain-containing protein [Chelativorans sp. ZYF759]